MTCDEFEKLYRKRLRKWARRLAQNLRLPGHMRADLYQSCFLVIAKQLKTWRPDGGMCAFDWCAPRMKREMTAEFRRYHGNPGYGWRRELHYFQEPLEDREAVDAYQDADLRIDVQRLLQKEGINRNTKRYLRMAVGGESGAEIASSSKQTPQAVNHALRLTGKRLAYVFTEYEDECPSDAENGRRGIAFAVNYDPWLAANEG